MSIVEEQLMMATKDYSPSDDDEGAPFDEDDVWNLKTPFYENKEQSAPSFHYILQDCIIVRE